MKVLILTQGGVAASGPSARLCGALRSLADEITLLVLGAADAVEPLRRIDGIDRLLQVEAAEPLVFTRWGGALAEWIARQDFSHVVMAADSVGKDLLPHLAALLDRAMVSEVVAIPTPNRLIRASHAGAVWQTVELVQSPLLMTIRASAFPLPAPGTPLPVTPLALSPAECGSQVLRQQALSPSRPPLHQAEIVIGVGRGVSPALIPLVEALADQLGAAVGGSRAAVDAGLLENAAQIGQSGAVIAPRLYIALGIAGADQHLAGIKDVGTLVAIDIDDQTPMMKLADYALQGDLIQCLPDLIALLEK